jgi:hypothetical protein
MRKPEPPEETYAVGESPSLSHEEWIWPGIEPTTSEVTAALMLISNIDLTTAPLRVGVPGFYVSQVLYVPVGKLCLQGSYVSRVLYVPVGKSCFQGAMCPIIWSCRHHDFSHVWSSALSSGEVDELTRGPTFCIINLCRRMGFAESVAVSVEPCMI